MEEKNTIVPFEEIQNSKVDLNVAVEQAKKMTEVLDAMGIEKATFKTGAMFHRDEITNTATLATEGLIVEERKCTTTVILRNEGSTEKEAIEELSKSTQKTQEVLGSFSGKSQSWTSKTLTKKEDEKS